MEITSKIVISSDVCNDDVVNYLATRYKCNPKEIVYRFFQQENIIQSKKDERTFPILEKNEMEILRDMHISPSDIEFV